MQIRTNYEAAYGIKDAPLCTRNSARRAALDFVLSTLLADESIGIISAIGFIGDGWDNTGIGIDVACCEFKEESVKRNRMASCFLDKTGFKKALSCDKIYVTKLTWSTRRMTKLENLEALAPFGDN